VVAKSADPSDQAKDKLPITFVGELSFWSIEIETRRLNAERPVSTHPRSLTVVPRMTGNGADLPLRGRSTNAEDCPFSDLSSRGRDRSAQPVSVTLIKREGLPPAAAVPRAQIWARRGGNSAMTPKFRTGSPSAGAVRMRRSRARRRLPIQGCVEPGLVSEQGSGTGVGFGGFAAHANIPNPKIASGVAHRRLQISV
jgi:hypothetical protein